jgi:Animal haem peroxidase
MSTTEATPKSGNLGEPGPAFHPDNGMWRPRSKREGMSLGRYIWWNWFYTVMEFFNRLLARNPNRKVSWDKWPPVLGLLYLISKVRFNRSNALTDPYDYMSNDNDQPCQPQPKSALTSIAADGKWTSDDHNGQMGAAMTRFASNFAPRKVRPDVEKITPGARQVSKNLRWRRLDSDGNEIVIPALILNVAAQAWIQFQFHNFGGNTLRDPINKDPYHVPRDPNEGWPENEATIDRTALDPTRVGYDGRPTPINEKVHAWVQGQIYGNNEAELRRLRSFQGGKLAFDSEGLLPEDNSRPGVDLVGYSNNYNPFLSFLHWLFAREHNAIADYLHAFDSSLDDDQLFELARKTNCAQIARIHTVEWTEDLLQHPALQLGMHADWYGFLGQRLKCYLMRLSHARPRIGRLLKPFRQSDLFWGAPGSAWEHFDGPFQVPIHFRMVYRLHEMILGKNEIIDPKTGQLLARMDLLDFVHEHTRGQVKRFGYAALGWSFLSKSCGALTLHNFPRSLTQFKRMQDDHLIDLAELDIFREREDGTGSYNDFRRSLGEPPVTSFLELTGGDAELAKQIEEVYQGEIDSVDAGVGILAEPKPAGFALGFVQFYQFVLNAPRRVKSNRFLSEGYNYDEYRQGMNWVEHGGGFKGAIRRHLPELENKLEGVKRGFAPWPDTEHFLERLLNEADSDISSAFLVDLRTLILFTVGGVLSMRYRLLSSWYIVSLLVVLYIAPVIIAVVRLSARRLLQTCEKKCNTDKRRSMFGALYEADRMTRRAALAGSFWAAITILLACTAAANVWPHHKWLTLLFLVTALSAISTIKWSRDFIGDLHVLKIALRNRMRNGQKLTEVDPGLDAARANELNIAFRTYAPGRSYLTAYDFARMREAEGSNSLNARLGMSSRQLLIDYGDLVVEEDRELVPAVTKKTCERLINGTAQIDLQAEKASGDDPSPRC